MTDEIAKIEISGGVNEIEESQGTRKLEPFCADVFYEDGRRESGGVSWSVKPEIMAEIDGDGVVTVNSHASCGAQLTVKASKNGVFAQAEIKVIKAAHEVYSADEIAVCDSEGEQRIPGGIRLFAGFEDTETILILPKTAQAQRYINIRLKKPCPLAQFKAGGALCLGCTEVVSLKPERSTDTVSVRVRGGTELTILGISVGAVPESEYEDNGKVRILCMGDSITEGFTVDGAYRTRLCALIEEAGMDQMVEFMGSRSNGSCYDGRHGGFSGFAIDDIPPDEDCEGNGRNGITARADECLRAAAPDIVLLQAGTNDILSLYRLDSAKSRLKRLVRILKERLAPEGVIYLASIPYMSESAKYNNTGKNQAELDELVDRFNSQVKEIAYEENIRFADINSVLTFDNLKDGIHPDEKGYEMMGDYWFGLIKDTLTDKIEKRETS